MTHLLKKLLLSLTLSPFLIAQDKVLIVTCSYSRPDFIEMQAKTFKAFMQDPYEFMVFDDAPDSATSEAIQTMCQKLSLGYQRIPQDVHNSTNKKQVGDFVRSGMAISIDGDSYNVQHNVSCRAADSLNYMMQTVGFQYPGMVCLVDSDLFLIKKFSVASFMNNNNYDLYGCAQQRGPIFYLWTGLIFFNNKRLPDKDTLLLDCAKIDGISVDTGGLLHCYLQEQKSLNVGSYNNTHIDSLPKDVSELERLGYHQQEIPFIMSCPSRMEFHIEHNFLHYCAGGNWDRMPESYHANKTTILNNFITSILE